MEKTQVILDKELEKKLMGFINDYEFHYDKMTSSFTFKSGDEEEEITDSIKFLANHIDIHPFALALGIGWSDRKKFTEIRALLREEATRVNMTEDIYLDKVIYPSIREFKTILKGWSRILYSLNYMVPKKGQEKYKKNPSTKIKIDGKLYQIKMRELQEIKTNYVNEDKDTVKRILMQYVTPVVDEEDIQKY